MHIYYKQLHVILRKVQRKKQWNEGFQFKQYMYFLKSSFRSKAKTFFFIKISMTRHGMLKSTEEF